MSSISNDLLYIDLFAGCGGLSLGLHQAGWKGLFAIEKSPDAFATLKHNLIEKINHFAWCDWLPKTSHDINEVIFKYEKELYSLRGKVDLIVGGPPCQGFSVAGRMRSDDVRNELVKSYIDFVNIVQPKMIFFENVKGFTLSYKKTLNRAMKYSDFVTDALGVNYDVTPKLVDFSQFGVPQKRCRFILIGIRKDIAIDKAINSKDFFDEIIINKEKFLFNKGIGTKVNLEEAISDLLRSNGTKLFPEDNKFKVGKYSSINSDYQKLMRMNVTDEYPDSHRFANHSNEIESRFTIALKNKFSSAKYRDFFKLKKSTTKVLFSDGLAPTLTSLPDDCIHFWEPRILTVREYARIQSFPDWFEFKGKYTTGGGLRMKEVPRYTQIGNAVPPLFGELAGLGLKNMISDEKNAL